ALASLAIGYLGGSRGGAPDVGVRGAEVAHISLMTLGGSERRSAGGTGVVLAAAFALVAAVLLVRSASPGGSARGTATKYLAPAARRSIVQREDANGVM